MRLSEAVRYLSRYYNTDRKNLKQKRSKSNLSLNKIDATFWHVKRTRRAPKEEDLEVASQLLRQTRGYEAHLSNSRFPSHSTRFTPLNTVDESESGAVKEPVNRNLPNPSTPDSYPSPHGSSGKRQRHDTSSDLSGTQG